MNRKEYNKLKNSKIYRISKYSCYPIALIVFVLKPIMIKNQTNNEFFQSITQHIKLISVIYIISAIVIFVFSSIDYQLELYKLKQRGAPIKRAIMQPHIKSMILKIVSIIMVIFGVISYFLL